MKIKESFINGKGILHFVGIIALIYQLALWGSTHYAQTTLLFPSSALGDLMKSGMFWQVVVFSIGAAVVALFVECVEWFVSQANLSWPDIIWSVLGAPFGVFLQCLCPDSLFLDIVTTFIINASIFHLGKMVFDKLRSPKKVSR